MSKQVNYNENLCSGAAIRDDKGRRISKLFEASHPKMTVGYAKNLIMPDTPTEQEFNFRQSGGGVIEDGVAVIDKVKGNSVVWNQLIPMKASGATETINGVTITYTDNGFRLQGTATNTFRFTTLGTCNLKEGHKYLTFGGSSGTSLQVEQWGGSPIDSRRGQPAIVTISTTPTALGQINIYCFSEEIFVGEELHWQFCDLTQMFGAGNEPTTYEEFLSRKPKVADEYAYNEGTIMNNKVDAIKTTGVNLWNEEWEVGSINITTGVDTSEQDRIRMKGYLPVLPNTSYYCTLISDDSTKRGYFCYYDQNKKHIAYSGMPSQYEMNKVFTTPLNCYFVRFYLNMEYGKTYNHNVCINLSDPAINGKYFPYEKHELDISWVKEIKDGEGVKLFEDGLKSAGTAFDEVGKNKAVKRVGVVDLGGLSYAKTSLDGQDCFEVYCSTLPQGLPKYAGYILSPIYSVNNTLSADKSFATSRGSSVPEQYRWFFRNDTYVTAADFKAAMSGVMLIYELAKPIEVEYDEKNLTYPVVAGGTEEAIASEPSTAFRADIGYGIDAVKTILDLKARVEALEGK